MSQSYEMEVLMQKRLGLGCRVNQERSFDITSVGLSSNILQDNGFKRNRTELGGGSVEHSVVQHGYLT